MCHWARECFIKDCVKIQLKSQVLGLLGSKALQDLRIGDLGCASKQYQER